MGSQRYPQHLGATAVLQTTVAAANQPLMDHKQGGVPLFKYSSGNTVSYSSLVNFTTTSISKDTTN